MKDNLSIIVGAAVEHFIPNAGTPNVAQTPPGSNDHAYGLDGSRLFQ